MERLRRVPGHNKICKFQKQIHVITIEDDDEVSEESPEGEFATPPSSPSHQKEATEELQVSMHAMSGTSSEASTFTLKVKIGKIHAIALVDNGSMATFMTPSIALKAQCKISNHAPIKVAVANGNILITESQSLNAHMRYKETDSSLISGSWN